MKASASLEEIEAFARSVGEDAKGLWFNPFAMASTMLTLADRVRDQEQEAIKRLRDWDRMTLAISLLIEKADGMTKKEIQARLAEIYGDHA